MEIKRLSSAILFVAISACCIMASYCAEAADTNNQGTGKMIIAVPLFAGADQDVAQALTDTFFRYLQKSKNVQLVEREQLKKVLEELDLTSIALFDREKVAQVGKQVGATHLVLGRYHMVYNQIVVTAGLSAVETGLAVPGAAATIKGNPEMVLDMAPHIANDIHNELTSENIPGYCEDIMTRKTCNRNTFLDYAPSYEVTRNETLSYNISPDELAPILSLDRIRTTVTPDHASGDKFCRTFKGDINLEMCLDRGPMYEEMPVYGQNGKMILSFTASEDCYVTLVNIDINDNVALMFPNKWNTDNFVRAGKAYTFPADEDAFDFKVSGGPGVEAVYAIATPGHFEAVSDASSKAIGGEVFPLVDTNAKAFTGKTVQAVGKINDQNQSAASIRIQFIIGTDDDARYQ